MTARLESHPARAGLRLGAGRTGVLLLILVFTYLLSAFTKGVLISAFQIVLFLAVVLITLRNGQLGPRAVRIASIVVLAGSVLAVVLLLVDRDGPGAGVANLWTGLILLLAAVLIVRRVLAQPEVTLQSIYGAISAYLVLGLMFAAFYAAMYRFGGNTFFAQGKPQTGDTRLFQYFSFVTLTTTGYGDYTAAGSGGQAVAVLESIAGVVFLATLVARLVAGFRGNGAGAGGRGSGGGPAPASREPAPAPRGPAGARRARTRRSGTSRLVGHRPPGTARRRPASGQSDAPPGPGR